jgi:arginine-tRNA-protein transferase
MPADAASSADAREPGSCPYPALAPPIPVPLTVIPAHPCPYLPGRVEVLRAFRTDSLPPLVYHEFLNSAFRRSGDVIYQPACPGCRACLSLRIHTADFTPNRTQRRCAKRNSDLQVTVQKPQVSDEKYRLYQRYHSYRHASPADAQDANSPEIQRESFENFLYRSPVDTLEFTYRDAAGTLVAVGICDICSLSLSSVYFWFDPAQTRRSLGTFGVLREIAFAFEHDIADYYIGYWVHGCPKMAYKAVFRPHEILHPDGRWAPAGFQ